MGRFRYKGFQTFIKDGCYWLSLCSIADDVRGTPVDLITAYNVTVEKGWVSPNAYIKDPCAILQWLTKRKWSLRVEERVPDVVEDNEWTVLKYYNSRTGFTHFRRRDVDTLTSSTTVAEGKLVACYVFVDEGAE